MNSHINISFPKAISRIIRETSNPEERRSKLAEQLVDRSTREQFLAWQRDGHEEFCSRSPLLQGLTEGVRKIEAIESNDTPAMAAHAMTKVLQKIGGLLIRGPQPKSFNERIEEMPGSIPGAHQAQLAGMVRDLTLYLEMGLVSADTIVQWLNRDDNLGLKFKPEVIFLLEDLPQEHRLKVFARGPEHLAPLMYKENLRDLLPFFSRLPIKDLVEILSLPGDASGRTPMHLEADVLIPCLARFLETPEGINGLEKLLTLEDSTGRTSLEASPTLFRLLDNPDLIVRVFSKYDKNGQTPMHKTDVVKNIGYSPLNALTLEQLISVLSTRNKEGRTPLQINIKTSMWLITYLEKRMGPTDDLHLLKLLSITDAEGRTLIHGAPLKTTFPLLRKLYSLNPEACLKLLSTEDQIGKTPLADKVRVSISVLQPILQQLTEQQLFTLFSHPRVVEDWQELQTSFERIESLKSIYNLPNAMPVLKALKLCDRFSNFEVISSESNGIRPTDLDWFVAGIKKHKLLSEQDLRKLSIISLAWLTNSKLEGPSATTISKEDYSKRVAVLKTRFEKQWNTLQFGSKEEALANNAWVPDTYLEGKTKDEIWAVIADILETIATQKAWLGTPEAVEENDSPTVRETKLKALHQFYVPLLLKAENILDRLEGKSPLEIAGFLISYAKTRLEGRCAAAYQSEHAQIERFITGRKEQVVEFLPHTCLQAVIDQIVNRNFGRDVHAMHQLRYAVGFEEMPDPLTVITLESAQRKILELWTLKEVLERMQKSGYWEEIVNYIKAKTPSDAYPELVKLRTQLQEHETQIELKARTTIEKEFRDERVVKGLEDFYRHFKGASLDSLLRECQTAERQELIKLLVQDTNKKLAAADKRLQLSAEEFESVAQDPEKYAYLVRELSQKINDLTGRPAIVIQRKFRTSVQEAFQRMKSIDVFDRKMIELSISGGRRKAFEGLCMYADELQKEVARIDLLKETPDWEAVLGDFAFDRETFRLPSQALEDLRRNLYNKEILMDPTRRSAYIWLLRDLGVVE